MTEILAEWPVDLAGLRIRERSGAICVLQVRDVAGSSIESLGRAFGVRWPIEPNTTAAHDGCTVLWLAPGQWAIIDLPAAAAAERAAAACGAMLHLLTDVSDGRIGFDISGALSRELLAQGCSLDLHPRVFKPGACAQTLLAQVPVLLHRPCEAIAMEDGFRLYADVSVASYLRHWFQDAASGFTSG